MTTTSLDILVRATDQATGVLKGVSAAGQRVDTSLTATGSSAKKAGGFFSSAGAKLAGFVGIAYGAKQAFSFGADAVKSAEDAQRSMDAFSSALKRTGQTADINQGKFNDWLQSMGEDIGQDDEDLRDLATTLASAFDFSQLKGDATENLMLMTRSIQDVSAATQKSSGLIKRSFVALANDPAGAVTQFQKLGVITEAQADHFKKMADNGKDAAVTQQILTLTGKRYGGAAAANTTASDKLATIWENMKEALGNFLLPLFTKFVDWLSKGISAFRDFASGGKTGNVWLLALKSTISAVVGVIVPLVGWLTSSGAVASTLRTFILALTAAWGVYKIAQLAAGAAQAAFNVIMSANPIGLVIAAVILLAVIIVKNWDTIKRVTFAVWGAIKRAIFVVWNVIKAPMIAYFNIYKAIFNAIKAVALVVWRAVVGAAKGAWNGIRAAFSGIAGWFRGIFNGVKGVILGIWDGIVGGIKSAVNAIIAAVNWVVDQINKVQIHVHVDPPGPGSINFDWNGMGLSHISPLAKGGITRGPMLALLGDNPGGREAVIPLPPGGGLGGQKTIAVSIDRRRWVDQADFETTYRGF